VVILPGDINSYRVNKQGKYRTQGLQIFLTIKMPCLEDKAYTIPVAVLIFKVIQGE